MIGLIASLVGKLNNSGTEHHRKTASGGKGSGVMSLGPKK
jgi:hypothetical protein